MMQYKEGDKVKFLNAPGGGVVTRIIDTKTVAVLIEDGFEIPTMISELVKIESNEPASRFFEDHYSFEGKKNAPEKTEPERADDRLSELPSEVTRGRKGGEIFLAFIPHDQKWLITGPVDVKLINNSRYDVLYNILHKNHLGHYEGVDYGSIFPDSELVLATINREQLTRWTEGCIQFIFHCDHSDVALPPFNADFNIGGKRFFKEGNYKPHAVIREKGIVAKIVSLNDYFREQMSGTDGEPDAPFTGGAERQTSAPPILKHRTGNREAEIDLHIHELVEDPSNLDSKEILEFQKNYFLRCLDSAITSHFLKVTVIHGVGNGVLRNALKELLKKYEGISCTDAPMAKYGVGALEIRIPHE